MSCWQVVESHNTLDSLKSKLQTALREEVSFVAKVQRLEQDKAALEEQVAQLAGQGAAQGRIGTELEESKREVCRLLRAMEEHEAASNQVRMQCTGLIYLWYAGTSPTHKLNCFLVTRHLQRDYHMAII